MRSPELPNHIWFIAINANDRNSCGHRHRTAAAAERCLPRLRKLPHAPGAAIRVRRVVDGVESQTL